MPIFSGTDTCIVGTTKVERIVFQIRLLILGDYNGLERVRRADRFWWPLFAPYAQSRAM